jgi:hypothetical protein
MARGATDAPLGYFSLELHCPALAQLTGCVGAPLVEVPPSSFRLTTLCPSPVAALSEGLVPERRSSAPTPTARKPSHVRQQERPSLHARGPRDCPACHGTGVNQTKDGVLHLEYIPLAAAWAGSSQSWSSGRSPYRPRTFPSESRKLRAALRKNRPSSVWRVLELGRIQHLRDGSDRIMAHEDNSNRGLESLARLRRWHKSPISLVALAIGAFIAITAIIALLVVVS